MRPTPSLTLESLLPPFLQRLGDEERLLDRAIAGSAGIYESLRRGDLAAVSQAQPEQEALATALRDAAAARDAAACELAFPLDLSPDNLTLATLADRLPPPWNQELRATRERLRVAAERLVDLQSRNANLIGHLRSFFRSTLSALVAPEDASGRYGPGGSRLSPGVFGAIQASG